MGSVGLIGRLERGWVAVAEFPPSFEDGRKGASSLMGEDTGGVEGKP
jgi:hypothetical protein